MFIEKNSVTRRMSQAAIYLGLVAAPLVLAALYVGCARPPDGSHVPRAQPVIEKTSIIDEDDFGGRKIGPVPTASPTPNNFGPISPVSDGKTAAQGALEEVEIVAHISGDFPHDFGVASLEERIVWSDVVARVRLLSVSAAVDTTSNLARDEDVTEFYPVLEFRFRVLEYLKGAGANEIVALALDARRFGTQDEVRAVLPTVTAERDTKWDDRDAIVFLEDSFDSLPSTLQQGRYFLGDVSYPLPGWDGYTIASRSYKHWLPAAASEGTAGSSGDDQQLFLMDAPADDQENSGSGATGSSSAPTITLAALKKRVTELNAEIAQGDGSEEYLRCVHSKYSTERMLRQTLEARGTVTVSVDRHIQSGLPAASVVHVDGMGLGDPPDKTGKYWLEGPDKDLFSTDTANLIPSDTTGDGVQDTLFYSRRLLTERPLPAGTYKMYPNVLWPHQIICNGVTDLERTANETVVHVTAPTGKVHEAFFDPATDGAAVGFSSNVGVLKPAGFSVGGTATTITGMEWDDGSITLTLDPYVALADHALDFIALDGTVSLYLNVSDATADALAKTLTWPVSPQPWQDGDLLMLRLYSVTPTLCPEAEVSFGACAPVFSPDSYTFTVSEAASTGHVAGSVSATTSRTGGAVSYSITAGNGAGKFEMSTGNDGGLILVWGSLDYETTSSYTLTVRATDSKGAADSATVEISVTNVP